MEKRNLNLLDKLEVAFLGVLGAAFAAMTLVWVAVAIKLLWVILWQ